MYSVSQVKCNKISPEVECCQFWGCSCFTCTNFPHVVSTQPQEGISHTCLSSFICPSEETEEHVELSKALAQIREIITAVDLKVSEYERHQRLQEVWNRMENRSTAKLKNGHTFRKQDMMGPGQTLKHQGVLLWKTATGRLKGHTRTLSRSILFLDQDHHSFSLNQ